MFKKLKLLIALVLGLCWSGTTVVQAQNVPDEYIYFDLAAGNVNISKTTYQGYVYVNGVNTTVSGTHSGSRKYYVYQSSSVTGSYDKDHTGYANNDDFSNKRNVRIPDYTAITGGGNTWEEFCTNNTDVRTVSTTWNASSTMASRTCCENRILINLEGGTESDLCDITIDNLWSEYSNFDETDLSESEFRARGEGGIYNYNGGYTVLRMKNHSKFHSICFPKKSSVPGYFKFTSFTGDGSTSGSITLTLLKGDDFSEEECLNSTSLIGGWYYENKRTPTSDLIFNGGTIYAGVENHVAKGPHICPTAIGGGACETGEVTINGGNVTAVTSSTAAAIGGGGGIGGVGKTGTVTITGGKVYAYNYGLYVDFYSADMDETLTAGASGTAIGGGSTVGWATSTACLGGEGNVKITGGEVFALSVGGNAIGGGNSYRIGGGTGTIIISGGNIIAKSVAGDIGSTHWTPSTAIGGGTGGVREGSGGDAVVNISGNPVILTGSIGGGKTSNATGKIGTAQVHISGNPDVSGQFILAAGSAVDPYFEMKGGIIHNSSTFDEVYYKVKEDGGAVYLENGKVSIQGGTIDNCKAKSGGAVYMTAGEFEMTGGTIKGGEATVNGGAVCMAAGEFTLSGGEIGVDGIPNKAQKGGGVYVTSGNVYVNGTGKLSYNSAINIGGGAYIDGGNIQMTNGEIVGNTAVNGGGGFYVPGGTVTITGGDVKNNIVTVGNGGGFYSVGGTVSISNATISGNEAENGYGGGLYSAAAITVGTEAMGTGATVSGNKAIDGGGFYVAGASGSVTTIQGGSTISGNEATHDGAGAYIASGNLKVNSSDIMGNHADYGNGGGFFVNGGALTLSGGNIGEDGAPNHAINGGGFYIQGGSSFIEGGTVQYNTATNGAGLYMKGTSDSTGDKATATFSGGTFTQNTAYSAGGGIYIDDYAELTMKGNSQITENTVVPTGTNPLGAGAGVYKRGQTNSLVMVSGSGSSESAELKIYNNTINGLPNNLYLDQYDDYLTIDAEGGLPKKMQLGVSVNTAGPKPLPTRVIHCTDFDILNGVFTKLMEAYEQTHRAKDEDYSFIYDDAERFLPVFASAPEPFTFKYIFFAEVWPSPYGEVPEDFDPDNISTPEELTYFMMKVNGIRCTKDATIPGNVVADIDMSGRLWIPIGGYQASALDVKVPYSGVFHGNGHTISGLECIGLTGTSIYGLFGDTQGATIENVNLADCNMTSGQADYFGLLVGKMTGGQVLNCNVSGTLDASGSGDGKSHEDQNDGGFIGGLVGGTFGDEVHIKNVISTVDIVAEFHKDSSGDYDNDKYIEDSRTVGGLVGITSSGTVIENGFANPKIEHGSWFPRYVGGLVGYNEGTLTNCYVRLGRGVTLNIKPGIEEFTYNNEPYTYDGTEIKSLFGMLAGFNKTSNNISNCYYPDNDNLAVTYSAQPEASVVIINNDLCDEETCKIYHKVITPYQYDTYMLDNQVDGGTTEKTTLLSTLNDWVETNGDTYSHWMRTEGSNVNDDYPVLSYDNLISTLNYTVVGSKDRVRLEYSNRFNEIFGRFEENKAGTLFVYRTPWGEDDNGSEIITADNTDEGDNVIIYVEENVALLQGTTSNLEDVYTCQVLKTNNGNQCWHTVASSLTGSKIGFDYGTETQVTWNEDTNPCNVTLAGSASSIFPTGTPIESLDLYSFYEPQYHWVNLKRNQQSHWHMNSHETPITYDETLGCGYDEDYFADNDQNDGSSTLVPGKGYLASIDKDMLIQGDGVLTNGEVTVLVTVCAGDFNTTSVPAIPAEQGTELKGYNLLGNPYQSYLSFAVFATENSALWSGTPSYAVYDAATGAYKQGSTSTTSKGSFAATGDINMHQGFFIVADNAGTATFDNTMRSDKPEGETHFRGEAPAYPLVNLVVTDATGTGDVAVVEFDRPEYNSAIKMKNIGADGKIYFHHNGGDQALLFLDEPTDHLPVHFEAIADGSYTMTWSTANATFSYLHLIDNMTGMDIDMLASDGYTFTASTSDYKSRFKMMFAYTGVEENEAAESETFAFMHDGALTVNGEGWLEVIDMCGRTIVSSRLTDAQSTVSLPNAASGLYVLKLTNDNRSKVQKIVVR